MARTALLSIMSALVLVACPAPNEKVREKIGADSSLPVLLKSRTFQPKPGIEPELARLLQKPKSERIHLIAQFDEVPGSRERRVLAKELQVRVLDTVPERAFFVSMPASMDTAKRLLQTEPKARWLGQIQPKDRLSPNLYDAEVPAWAIHEDGRAELIVLFFGDVGVDQQRDVLRQIGASTVSHVEQSNGWWILLERKQIAPLAQRDEVRWIEEAQPPPEPLNDLVRGVEGVDANPVLDPALPDAHWLDDVASGVASPPVGYDLSGDGVVIGLWEPGSPTSHQDFDGRLTVVAPGSTGQAEVDHATHVAGIIIGNGSQSISQLGWPRQWTGVAPEAEVRSYHAGQASVESMYDDAKLEGANLSNNSWGIRHQNLHHSPTAYTAWSSVYDEIMSGRRSDGGQSPRQGRVLIVASAGNEGLHESYRLWDHVIDNDQFDAGEYLVIDADDDGVFDTAELNLRIGAGSADPVDGDILDDFNWEDKWRQEGSAPNTQTFVYRDADYSESVTPGDIRVVAPGFTAGSTVVPGDTDQGQSLTYFYRSWRSLRNPNDAKNTVNVANITSDGKQLSNSSSRGPTPDGRIKPDVAAPGDSGLGGVKSTIETSSYAFKYGTSMAAPAVTGVAALLTEWYRTSRGATDDGLTPALLRALLIHGAEDLTTIPPYQTSFSGPDYAFGYGRVRAPESLALIPHHRSGEIEMTGDAGAVDIQVPVADGELKVTLVWDDPPWTTNGLPSPNTGLLQNDLDLLLIAPDGTTFTPWVLDPFAPRSPATRADIPSSMPEAQATQLLADSRDHLNTVEQVWVPDAMSGDWTIRVSASALNHDPQPFVVVGEAIHAENVDTGGAVDVWIRDYENDNGDEPSTQNPWRSPDIWNRLSGDCNGEHQNATYGVGLKSHVCVRLRNRGTQIARATNVEVWISPAAPGQKWPDDFVRLGTVPAPNLEQDGERTVSLEWSPWNVGQDLGIDFQTEHGNHYCFHVRLTNPQDPTETSGYWLTDITKSSNNIAWRNVRIVDLASSEYLMFVLRNTENEKANVSLTLLVPPEFLKAGLVRLELQPELERRWFRGNEAPKGLEVVRRAEPRSSVRLPSHSDSLGGKGSAPRSNAAERGPRSIYRIVEPQVQLPALAMQDRERHLLTLMFASKQVKKAAYEVEVIQQNGDTVVGGIVYQVRTGKW